MAEEGLTPSAAAMTPPDMGTPSMDSADYGAEGQPVADPYASVADLDVDELIRRHPKLQGKIGALSQKQALAEIQRLTRQRQMEQEAQMERARREELRQLARNDPDRLAEVVQRDLRKEDVQARERELWMRFQRETGGQLESQFNEFYQRPIVKEVWAKTDDATRAKLDWRNYDSVGEWAEAAADVLAEHKADSKARKRVEAATKSGRVEAMAGEASEGVDLGLGGMVEGGRRFRRSEIDPKSPNYMGRDLWRRNAKAIEYQIDHGLLVQD
jgi:hypothetical protein